MAGGKILCVSFIDGVYHYLEVDKKSSGYFPQHPQSTNSVDALISLCRKADEIHLSSIFPSAIYQQTLFPKVSRRYMPGLIAQDAREKLGTAEPVMSRFKNIKEVSDAGVTKWQTWYCAVLQSEVLALWDTFSSFKKKIRFISPVSVAVASMVSQLENPQEDFAVIWVGEKNSLMVISSPEGHVYVARNVPLSLDRKKMNLEPIPDGQKSSGEDLEVDMDRLFQEESQDESDSHESEGPTEQKAIYRHTDMDKAGAFSRELEKELGMTTTFFKQELRKPAPKLVYLLGNPNLKNITEVYPLPSGYEDVRFQISTQKYRGLSPEAAGDNIHILGNLFIPEAFNYIPEQEAVKRKSNLMLNAALILLAAGLGLSIVWTDRLHYARSSALDNHEIQIDRLQQARAEVASLQAEVNQLRPIEGWKQFYDTTMAEKPPWNMFVSELALLMEDYVVLDSFQVQSGEGAARDCRVEGKIRADNWEEGLELFRKFGKKLQSSSMFDVSDINYAPEGVSNDPSMFDFQMDLKLKDQGGVG
ncbi:MAG: hypothetical protein ACLFP9_09570 [Desulfonatronovibrio sp.]